MREQEKYKESSALKVSIVTKYSLVNEKVVSRKGFSGGTSGKESTCQCRRCGFNPWVGKIPSRRARQPTPVSLPGELHEQRSWQATVHGISKSEHTLFQWLSPPHTHSGGIKPLEFTTHVTNIYWASTILDTGETAINKPHKNLCRWGKQ